MKCIVHVKDTDEASQDHYATQNKTKKITTKKGVKCSEVLSQVHRGCESSAVEDVV